MTYALRILGFTLIGVLGGTLLADTVDVKNGARIIGKISKIDAGAVEVDTDYAGKITIKQSQVTAITTDAPIAVRLASGTRFDGKVTAGSSGGIQIAGAEGTLNTTIDKVAATWSAGKVDPAVERHWVYEASVDVSGKTGNKEQIGTAGELRAVLKTTQDTLQFYSSYNRQISDGAKSADQFKAGVDYSNNFAGRYSWYLRDEGGFDRVKSIDLYNIAAAGLGFDVVKRPKQTLTGRAGLSFRYEGYKNSIAPSVKSAGLDIGFNNDMEFGNSKLVNRVAYVPTFEDFGNYRITHESYYQIPLTNPNWKLRIGVSNDYNSQPPRGTERLDTAYFTRLVLNWQ
jgi:hypothetical protein